MNLSKETRFSKYQTTHKIDLRIIRKRDKSGADNLLIKNRNFYELWVEIIKHQFNSSEITIRLLRTYYYVFTVFTGRLMLTKCQGHFYSVSQTGIINYRNPVK